MRNRHGGKPCLQGSLPPPINFTSCVLAMAFLSALPINGPKVSVWAFRFDAARVQSARYASIGSKGAHDFTRNLSFLPQQRVEWQPGDQPKDFVTITNMAIRDQQRPDQKLPEHNRSNCNLPDAGELLLAFAVVLPIGPMD